MKIRKLTPGVNDLQTLFPQIAAELDGIDPTTVLAGSTKGVRWRCSLCEEAWETAPRSRTKAYRPEPGCPTCAKRRAIKRRGQKLTMHDVYPELVHELKDPEQAKEVSYSSHTVLTWVCDRQHEYDMKVNTRLNGRNCPYCNFRELLPGFNDLETLFPHIAAELVNPALGSQVMANATDVFDWTHITDDGVQHFWTTSVKSRAYEDQAGCLVCSGRVVQIGVNDFKSQYLAQSGFNWHERNEFQPDELTRGSTKKVSLSCEKHSPANILVGTAKSFSSGKRKCLDCRPTHEKFVSKAEHEIADFLRETFPYLKIEQSVRRFKKYGVYEIDILVNKWLAIDFNGILWHREGDGKPYGYHVQKRRAVEALGFVFVEVLEENWLADYESILRDLAANVREGRPQFDPH